MKTLFIGGIKSGKSKNAETYILSHTTVKPIYLATTEFIDDEMAYRITEHKKQRENKFITIEESINLYEIIKFHDNILIECISMWINNMMYHKYTFENIKTELEHILTLEKNIVFVLNDVGTGIIPENKLARRYIDISGKLSQLIASRCDEVFHTIAGISTKIK